MNKCEYCRDPEKAVTIFRQNAGNSHKVQAIMDCSPTEASVTFAVIRMPKGMGRPRQFLTGFGINYCPLCGRRLRTKDTTIQ